jgi:hypothetical protein
MRIEAFANQPVHSGGPTERASELLKIGLHQGLSHEPRFISDLQNHFSDFFDLAGANAATSAPFWLRVTAEFSLQIASRNGRSRPLRARMP